MRPPAWCYDNHFFLFFSVTIYVDFPKQHLVWPLSKWFFFFNFIYLFLERGEGREKERDRDPDVREKHWSVCLSCALSGTPHPGTEPTTPACARPGITLATFCFEGWSLTNLATPVRAGLECFLMKPYHMYSFEPCFLCFTLFVRPIQIVVCRYICFTLFSSSTLLGVRCLEAVL